MTRANDRDSIENEPHITGEFRRSLHEVELPAEELSPLERAGSVDPDSSVFDEPSHRVAGVAAPHGALTFASWLDDRRARTTALRSLTATALIALVTGPWSVVGAFGGSGQTFLGLLLVVLFGPIVEEVMKVAALAYVIEKKPYLLLTRWQVVFTGGLSGLAFAVIENLLYLHLYIDDPTPEITSWRWTVCTALHVACSSIAALGLARAWRRCITDRAPPDLSLGYPHMLTAVVLHGAYNALMVALDVGARLF